MKVSYQGLRQGLSHVLYY